jgi:predicted DNA-binding transcriptional regulator YafY
MEGKAMPLRNCVGKTVVMIYMDLSGRISQRRVVVRKATDRYVHAFCLERGAPRLFLTRNILAALPAVMHRAG